MDRLTAVGCKVCAGGVGSASHDDAGFGWHGCRSCRSNYPSIGFVDRWAWIACRLTPKRQDLGAGSLMMTTIQIELPDAAAQAASEAGC
jgi:hypothetical protein